VYGREKENDYRNLIGRIEEKETLQRRGHSGKMISRGCGLDLSGSG
jgi:hypothetical protein